MQCPFLYKSSTQQCTCASPSPLFSFSLTLLTHSPRNLNFRPVIFPSKKLTQPFFSSFNSFSYNISKLHISQTNKTTLTCNSSTYTTALKLTFAAHIVGTTHHMHNHILTINHQNSKSSFLQLFVLILYTYTSCNAIAIRFFYGSQKVKGLVVFPPFDNQWHAFKTGFTSDSPFLKALSEESTVFLE